MNRRIVTVALSIAAAFLVGAPVAQAAPSIDCARQPYGVSGCEAHLGSVVRREQGLTLPGVSNYELGRVVQRLCFGEPFGEIKDSIAGAVISPLALNLRKIDAVKGGYCG